MQPENLLRPVSQPGGNEWLEDVLQGGEFRVERIVSTGQVTPAGQWLDQARHEWVLLLSGAAKLQFDDGREPFALQPGDAVNIPAHARHRVAWTDPNQATIWLAVHYR